jgi:hypothetical protein
MAQLYNKQLHFPLSGSFTGSFSGSFFGDGSGITNVSAIGIGAVTASTFNDSNVFIINSGSRNLFRVDNTGSLEVSGSLTQNTSGSFPYFFLIKNNGQTLFQVNSQGVTQTKVFDSGSEPTAVYGGIYFTSQSFFVALDSATFK